MGGRAAGGARGPMSGEPPPKLRMRERFGALRNLPPFLGLI
jgi:ATP-binding cassette subfamily B protein